MILPPVYKEEKARMQDLRALDILDTSPDIRYDLITDFAVNMLKVPICFISLIDSNRQWFKSEIGMGVKETTRDSSICAHAICDIKSRLAEERIYEVTNTETDKRFFDNPLITGAPYIKSYLSYVLQSNSGQNIGSFCLIDTKIRVFSNRDYEKLILLGSMTENLLHGRHYLSGLADKVH